MPARFLSNSVAAFALRDAAGGLGAAIASGQARFSLALNERLSRRDGALAEKTAEAARLSTRQSELEAELASRTAALQRSIYEAVAAGDAVLAAERLGSHFDGMRRRIAAAVGA